MICEPRERTRIQKSAKSWLSQQICFQRKIGFPSTFVEKCTPSCMFLRCNVLISRKFACIQMFSLAISFLYLAHPVRLRCAALLLPAEPIPHELLEVERCAPVCVHLLAPAVLVPGLRIRIHFGSSILGRIPIRIQGFHDKKLKKNYS